MESRSDKELFANTKTNFPAGRSDAERKTEAAINHPTWLTFFLNKIERERTVTSNAVTSKRESGNIETLML